MHKKSPLTLILLDFFSPHLDALSLLHTSTELVVFSRAHDGRRHYNFVSPYQNGARRTYGDIKCALAQKCIEIDRVIAWFASWKRSGVKDSLGQKYCSLAGFSSLRTGLADTWDTMILESRMKSRTSVPVRWRCLSKSIAQPTARNMHGKCKVC